MSLVREAYERELAQRGFQSDPAQLHAVEVLDRCAREWVEYQEQNSSFLKKLLGQPEPPRGGFTCTAASAAAKAS
jgi:cell division protein ZapE